MGLRDENFPNSDLVRAVREVSRGSNRDSGRSLVLYLDLV